MSSILVEPLVEQTITDIFRKRFQEILPVISETVTHKKH